MKKLQKILIVAFIFLAMMTICMPQSLAVRPSDLTGDVSDSKVEREVTKITDKIALAIKYGGTFIAVGVMLVIGIKYMVGSVEEKASYKKSMFPYLVGCIILFGASMLVDQIFEVFKDQENDAETMANTVLGIIQVIGTFVAVGTLMLLGIKYMVGSAEEKASYKKSMLPYLIGAVLLFAGVNVTAMVYNTVALDPATTLKGDGDGDKPGAGEIKRYQCPDCGYNMMESAAKAGKCPRCKATFTPLIDEEKAKRYCTRCGWSGTVDRDVYTCPEEGCGGRLRAYDS